MQVLTSGRHIPHFYGPGESYSRSLVGAWRQFHDSEQVPSVGPQMPGVGDRVDVWWTGDKRWLTATIAAIEVDGSSCVSMVYDVDGEELCHE